MAGRKSKAEELKIIDRYAALAEPFFEILQKALTGKNKREQHWAIEQLSKGFVKMIPQKIAGDPDNRTPIPLLYALHNNNSNKKD
jgi:hypothetical protein